MYSYIPESALIKGLSLGELFYANLDSNLKIKEEYVQAAMSHSMKTVYHIPAAYFEQKQSSDKFSLKSFIKSEKDSPVELIKFLVSLDKNSVNIDGVSAILNDEKFLTQIITNAARESDSVLNNVLTLLPKSHILFNDVEFTKKVFSLLEKKFNIVEQKNIIKSVITYYNKALVSDLYKDFEILRCLLLSVSVSNRFNFEIPSEVVNNPKTMVELFKFCQNDFGQGFKNMLSFVRWNKNLKNDKDFVRLLAKLINEKNKKIDCGDLLFNGVFGEKLMKDTQFIHSVLKDFVDDGCILNAYDWWPVSYYKVGSFLKNEPEYAKFLFGNIPGMIFMYFLNDFEDGLKGNDVESIKLNLDQQQIISCVSFDDVPEIILNEWVLAFKDVDAKFFEVLGISKNDIKADKESLTSVFTKLKDVLKVS